MKLTAKQIARLVKQGEVVHTECKDASGGLPDALWESYSSFANTDGGVILLGVKEAPGIFRVNKTVAVEGGTSDARNSHIFNIFALVDIGERSGMGLADLYGHWKKYNLPEPTITEEYDPDRVKITVYTDPDKNPARSRTEPVQSAQGCPKGAPRVPQECPKPAQGCSKSAPDRPKHCTKSAQAIFAACAMERNVPNQRRRGGGCGTYGIMVCK